MIPPARTRLAKLFGIDTRTLALFRIVLAALVLFDLFARGQHLEEFYTDAGILPADTREVFGASLSIHWLSGSFAFQLGLLAAHIAAAAALLVGYRAQFAAFVCWALLTSLHFRSPHLNDGGDAIARMMLLWSIFLPLGARFSLDAKRAAGPALARVLSPASVALLIQFVLFYSIAGISKNGPAWLDGSAVAAAVDNSYWSRPFGDALLGSPALLEFLTFATRSFEILGPLLLFIPIFTPQIRLATILGFWCFQFGLASSLELNLFPLFASTATLAFIPAWFWDRFCPDTRIEDPPEATRGLRQHLEAGVAASLLLASLTLGIGTLGWISSPRWLNKTARYVGFEQSWTMYAPHPPIFDLHFRVLGSTTDGEILTLVGSNDTVSFGSDWLDVAEFHTGYRIKDHLEHLMLLGQDVEPLRQSYLDWVCRTWNAAEPDRRITDAAFVALSRRTLASYDEMQEPRMLAERACN